MTSAANHLPADSYGYLASKISSAQSSCNTCKRLLYSFEEILICRICHGSYHRRCLKNEPYSRYGNYDNFTCESCQKQTPPAPTPAIVNMNKTRSIDSLDSHEFDFDHSPTKLTNGNTNHYTKTSEQIPTRLTTKISDLDDYLPSSTERPNNQYDDDDSQTTSARIQQQDQLDSDDETNEKSNMFHANYQYTPLKDYAATKSQFTNNSNSSAGNFDQQSKPRYTGGLQYSDHGYDPTVSRAVDIPSLNSTKFSSPTVENLSNHNRQHSYISTTSLTINDKSNRQQNNHSQLPIRTFVHSHAPDIREKSFSQSQLDRYSTTGSDSGIVTITSNSHSQFRSQQDHLDHIPSKQEIADDKLTNLVQQLGKQFEVDAQKLNEKLENKLEEFEKMIHHQTSVIQRQEQVINDLKKQILQIENERDHYRQRLSVHEQQQGYQKKMPTNNQANEQNHNIETKSAETSTGISVTSRPSVKKKPAPRIETQRIVIYDERSPAILSKPIKTVTSSTRERKDSSSSATSTSSSSSFLVSTPPPPEKSASTPFATEKPVSTTDKLVSAPPSTEKPVSTTDKLVSTSFATEKPVSTTDKLVSTPSSTEKLASTVPVVEPLPATNRLSNIINQSTTKRLTIPSSANYSLPQVRRQDRLHLGEPISMEQFQVTSSIHADDSDNEPHTTNLDKRNSSSSSASSWTSTDVPIRERKPNSTAAKPSTNLIPNKFPSFETLQDSFQSEQAPRLGTKTASLQFGRKAMRDDDAGSIHLTPVESNYPAVQAISSVKGWLRKQNRESFFKRIERYYCVLTDAALLMHRHEEDHKPCKAINLRGAKVFYYDDSKYGPSLELTWSSLAQDEKHYHLYAPNPQEAERWVKGIQTIIHNLENKQAKRLQENRYS